MTRFRFTLQRVLDFRRMRADIARSTLERLRVERQRLVAEALDVQTVLREEELRIRVPGMELTAARLDALGQLQSYVQVAVQRLNQQMDQLDARILEQQAAVMDAERQVGLLEKLESRQQADWQSLADRELDELAADAYMSRFHRESKLNGR